MESGCKQLGQGRLKIAGAQWNEHGARLVARAGAAFLNGQRDIYPLCLCSLVCLSTFARTHLPQLPARSSPPEYSRPLRCSVR